MLYTGGSQTTTAAFSFGNSSSALQNTIFVSNANTVLTVSGQETALTSTNSYRFYKQGAGTLAFTYPGANSFNNNAFMLVDAGTLQLGATGQVNTIANGLIVGNQLAAAGGTPVLNVIGGTTNINGSLAFSNGDPNAGQILTANLSGGTVNATAVQLVVNGTTTSNLNLSGAAILNDTGNVQGTGAAAAGETSTITISGTAQFNNTGTAISFLVGSNGGTTTVNQNGGTATFNAGLQITGTGSTVETGTYNLGNGTAGSGTLDTLSLSGNSTNAASSAVLNFNGGTLQAFASSTAFVTGLTSANVLKAGATIDTQAFTVVMSQPLLASTTSTGGGLTKIGTGMLTLTGNSTYTGPTVVSAGILEAATPTVLPSTAVNTNKNTVAGGATLAAAVGGTGQFQQADVDALVANSTFATGSFLGFDTTGGNFTYATNLAACRA